MLKKLFLRYKTESSGYVLWVMVCLVTQATFAQTPPANKPEAAVTQTPAPYVVPINSTFGVYPNTIPVNYVRTKQAMGAITDEAAFSAAAYTEVKEMTQYADGLGRPLQTINRQATPGSSPQDIVVPQVYDAYGREVYKFMPYVASTSDGSFKMDPFNEQKNFLQIQYPGEQVFYSKTNFEFSPLNRVEKTFVPGNSWAGSEGAGVSAEHALRVQYLTNSTADQVRVWHITSNSLA